MCLPEILHQMLGSLSDTSISASTVGDCKSRWDQTTKKKIKSLKQRRTAKFKHMEGLLRHLLKQNEVWIQGPYPS